jgi:succinoglycan biosynthesis protein ExoA
MTSFPKISVVLPVLNESERLPLLLLSLVEQEYPIDAFEILVADGGSTDGTRELVTRFAATVPIPVRLVDNPGRRSGPGRNAGVAASSGDIIVFIDGHCQIPSRYLLRDTAELFAETGAQCLCRPQPLIASPATRMGAAIAMVRASTLGHGRDSLIYNMRFSGFVDPASSGASYLRSVFDSIGHYDEVFDACEDVEFNTRLRDRGMKAYTDPRLAVYYEPRRDLKGLFRQMMRYGRGRVRLAEKHPRSISVTQFAPVVLGALWVIALIALFLPGWWRIVPWLLLAPYIVAVTISTIVLARRQGSDLGWRAPLIYLAVHLGLGWGMFVELCSVLRARFRRPDESPELGPVR